jgi:malonyl-CoA O-methyltransferase
MDKDKVKRAFGRAALTYDDHAYVQKIASEKLIRLTESLPYPKHVLEIGCGTGYLTSKLLSLYQEVPYLATDISEDMIRHCKEKYLHYIPRLNFQVQDGEKVDFAFSFDWIISSFAFQWFEKQLESIQTLYQNSQYLIFTTLLEGTFQEWKELCNKFNLPDKVLCFINEEDFLTKMRSLNPQYLSIETEKEFYPTPLSFLTRLRNIGAHESRNSDKRMNIKNMKKVIEKKEPLEISYRIAYCILKNDNF